MIGHYPYSLVRKYIMEQTGITDGTWSARKKDFPQPSKRISGVPCYTEDEVRDVLAWWEGWWKTGRGSSLRDTSKSLFGDN